MKRTYRERKHYCGDYLEVEIIPVYTKAKRRGKRRKLINPIQQHYRHDTALCISTML